MSQETENTETKLYELSFNIIPSLVEGDLKAELEAIKKVLSDNGTEIFKEGETKLIDLKYTMVKHIAGSNQKFGQAYFGWIKFNGTSEAVEDIKVKIEAMENVLRHLLIKTVDDEEHSTSKISLEEGDEGIAEAGEKEAEKPEVKEESKKAEATESKDEVDEAIEEAVK